MKPVIIIAIAVVLVTSLLMVDTSWGMIDPMVVLTQEKTTVETRIPM